MKADWVSILIDLLLVVYSICSWAIIFDKILKFRLFKITEDKFNKIFWSEKSLEDIYLKTKKLLNCPFAIVFNHAMYEWEKTDVASIVENKDDNKKKYLLERISNNMDIVINKSISKIKFGMTFLLIVSNTSTFFGLFGMVWGVFNTFLSISTTQDSSLIVIAPGITNALVTTIFGLAAAIPATIAHSYYTARINSFEDQLINFSINVNTILSRELNQN